MQNIEIPKSGEVPARKKSERVTEQTYLKRQKAIMRKQIASARRLLKERNKVAKLAALLVDLEDTLYSGDTRPPHLR